MIPFNIPLYIGNELIYIKEAIEAHRISGDGDFTKKCNNWFEERFRTRAGNANANISASVTTVGSSAVPTVPKVLLTTSGSTALDMAALMCDIQPGDEVILPSFTFSSTANSFVLAGAKLVFVDIRPDTMNIDENKIEAAITPKTRVICVVHYAGISCEMDTILSIAKKYDLLVVEDAAQGVMSTYKSKMLGSEYALGTLGDFGCYSFHETKNYSMGEGGAIVINNEKYIEKAEILREKGTNRSQFFRGQVAKYNWVDFGDSYLPSEILAAYLWAQLLKADEINENRLRTWNSYNTAFAELAEKRRIEVPTIPEGCKHNAHMYYIKLKNLAERTNFIAFMKERGIGCVFHYVPLHSAPAGIKFGRFSGEDVYTTKESDRLVRLPLYYGMTDEDRETVIKSVLSFFSEKM